MAVVDIGLTPDQYYNLSLYEYGLYVMRHDKEAEIKQIDYEHDWEIARQLWVPLMQAVWKPLGGKNWKPQDLIKLSYDKQAVEEKPMSFKEAKQLMGATFTPKNKNGN